MEKVLMKNYNIDVIKIIPVKKGMLNLNYRVNSKQGTFFLKRYDNLSHTELIAILNTEDYLYKKGISIIHNIKNNLGFGYVLFNKKIYVLYPFINGVHPVRNFLTTKEVFILGEFLAEFHKASLDDKKLLPFIPTKSTDIFDPFKSIKKIDVLLKKYSKITHLNKNILNILLIKKQILESYSKIVTLNIVPECITHGDYQDQNIFYINKKVPHRVEDLITFDIEKAKYSSRYIEISRFIVLVCLSNGINNKSSKLTKNFILGYSSKINVDSNELGKCINFLLLKKIGSTWAESEYMKDKKTMLMKFIRNDLLLMKQIFNQPDYLNNLLAMIF